jgi:hypothetical protein
MFKFIQQYLNYRNKMNLEKAQSVAARDAFIEQARKDGTLWVNSQYPKGHPAYIPTVD